MDEITLVDYDPAWPAQFAEEAARIRTALGDSVVVTVEHFGSTAVPGLSAKPITDLLVAVRSLPEAREQAVPALEALGYAYWHENPASDCLFFVKGLPPNGPRTHHAHIVDAGEFSFIARLLFRNYLRADWEEARRYEDLKRRLSAAFPDDREAYTAGKTDYIDRVMQKARTRAEG